MNIYSISTGCYSDYHETMLTHDELFTEKEFKKICSDATQESELIYGESDNYIDINEEVEKILINKLGFKKLKYLNCHIFDYSCYGELPQINKIGE